MTPPDSSRAASAPCHEAGLPMRMAVATVSGCSTGGAAHDGSRSLGLEPEHPRPASRRRHARVGVANEASPAGGDVAGVADRQGNGIGRLAQRIDDLEGNGLLAGDAVGVDRVDDRRHAVVAEPAHGGQRLVEVAVDHDQPGAGRNRLRQLAAGNLAGRQDDVAWQTRPRRRRRPRRRSCCRSRRRPQRRRLGSAARLTARTMPRSLKLPVGFVPSNFRKRRSRPSSSPSRRAWIRGVSPSPSVIGKRLVRIRQQRPIALEQGGGDDMTTSIEEA